MFGCECDGVTVTNETIQIVIIIILDNFDFKMSKLFPLIFSWWRLIAVDQIVLDN